MFIAWYQEGKRKCILSQLNSQISRSQTSEDSLGKPGVELIQNQLLRSNNILTKEHAYPIPILQTEITSK